MQRLGHQGHAQSGINTVNGIKVKMGFGPEGLSSYRTTLLTNVATSDFGWSDFILNYLEGKVLFPD